MERKFIAAVAALIFWAAALRIPLIPLAFSAILLAFMFGFIAAYALLGKFVFTKTFSCHTPNTGL